MFRESPLFCAPSPGTHQPYKIRLAGNSKISFTRCLSCLVSQSPGSCLWYEPLIRWAPETFKGMLLTQQCLEVRQMASGQSATVGNCPQPPKLELTASPGFITRDCSVGDIRTQPVMATAQTVSFYPLVLLWGTFCIVLCKNVSSF